MTFTADYNECLQCTHSTYDDNEVIISRLTGKTFNFDCDEAKMEHAFRKSVPLKISVNDIKEWPNNCQYYNPRSKS